MPLLTLPIVEGLGRTPRFRVVRVGLGGRDLPFLAGQYVGLGAHGGTERCPYSIACSPAQARRAGALEFLIQVGKDASPGPHLPSLSPGTLVDVEGPEGTFVLPPESAGRDVLFVGGGTGIAPLRAMLWQVLEISPDRRVGVVHSARTPADLAYGEELRGLDAAGRIRLLEAATRDAPASWRGVRGRVGLEHLRACLPSADPLCFVCGPDSLVADVPRLLGELGVAPALVRTEKWADQSG